MFPDEKMNTEEAANKAATVLESISNNLQKFLETNVGAGQVNKNGLYAHHNATTPIDKRELFSKNLVLVNEGRKALYKAMQESVDRKLVSPIQSR